MTHGAVAEIHSPAATVSLFTSIAHTGREAELSPRGFALMTILRDPTLLRSIFKWMVRPLVAYTVPGNP